MRSPTSSIVILWNRLTRRDALARVISGMVLCILGLGLAHAADPTPPPGMRLAWSDEFTTDGPPNSSNWGYETGFVRSEELQFYQAQNAACLNGKLVITGKRERILNPNYDPASTDWRKNRQYAEYTSSSLLTAGKQAWTYGRFEINARIDARLGLWPAIWTWGSTPGIDWPENGEIDIMEYYNSKVLANACWGSGTKWTGVWDSVNKPLSYFTAKDPEWSSKFHTWRMDWDENFIKIFIDDELINTIDVEAARNPDGYYPFRNPQILILNLAIGAAGQWHSLTPCEVPKRCQTFAGARASRPAFLR